MSSLVQRSTSPEGIPSSLARDRPPRLQPLTSLDWLLNDNLPSPDSPSPQNSPNAAPRDSTNDNFIDLTGDSSPLPPARTQSQPAPQSDQEPARKRRRIAEDLDGQASSSTPFVAPGSAAQPSFDFSSVSLPPRIRADIVDEVDLTQVEDDTGLRPHREERVKRQKEVEEQQRQLLNESIAAQNLSTTGSSTLSQLSCIICMETITDLTATHCGHIFCHTCIMEALIAGENQGPEPGKGQSRCPVCREKVLRKPSGKKQPQVIPLELKLKTKSEKAKGKQRELVESYADPPIGD